MDRLWHEIIGQKKINIDQFEEIYKWFEQKNHPLHTINMTNHFLATGYTLHQHRNCQKQVKRNASRENT